MIKYLIISVLIIVNILLIGSFGTGDVDTWVRIIDHIRISGFSELFPACLSYNCGAFFPGNYPPGHFLPLFFFSRILTPLNFPSHLILKITIFIFYLLSLFALVKFRLIVGKFSKHKVSIAAVFLIFLSQISLIINAQGLGYTDFFMAPFLTLALYFLLKDQWYFGGLFYGFSILMKWQPIILMPLILVLAVRSKGLFIRKLTFSAAGIFSALLLLIPLNSHIIQVVFFSLTSHTLADPVLSSALNLQWLATFLYKTFFPEIFGSLASSSLTYINMDQLKNAPVFVLVIPRIIFYAGLILILIKYFTAGRLNVFQDEARKFLSAGILISLFYFFVSSGVHENHFFLTVYLGLLLYLINPSDKNKIILLILDVIFFMNLFLFYGLLGYISRIFIFGIDATLLAAFLNSIIFFPFLFIYFLKQLPAEK